MSSEPRLRSSSFLNLAGSKTRPEPSTLTITVFILPIVSNLADLHILADLGTLMLDPQLLAFLVQVAALQA